jgi:hypothetical protein
MKGSHSNNLIGHAGLVSALKSIFSGTQYVNLQKYFSHPSLVIYFFATPPIKLKLGQQIGGGLLIANHLDQSLG